MNIKRRNLFFSLVLGITIIILVLIISNTWFIKSLELKSLDYRFKLRGRRESSPEIVLVNIDDDTINTFGWPLGSDLYAGLLEIIRRCQAKVIGFDILFSSRDTTNPKFDLLLAEIGKLAGNVCHCIGFILPKGQSIDTTPHKFEKLLNKFSYPIEEDLEFIYAADIISPIEEILKSANFIGHINVVADIDGVVRRVPLFIKYRERYFPSLGLQLACSYLNIRKDKVRIDKEGIYLDDLFIPTNKKGELLINYAGGFGSFKTYSFLELVKLLSLEDEEINLSAPPLKDKIVLIGVAASGASDIGSTPFSSLYPMLEIHANVINNILQRSFLSRVDRRWEILMVILFGISLGFFLSFLSPLNSLILTLGYLFGYAFLCFYLFKNYNLWLNFTSPFLVILGSFSIIGYQYLNLEVEKKKIGKRFSQFVSKKVVEQILKNPEEVKLGGERRELTVMFCDIRDFTYISEKIPPEKVVATLNKYFQAMTQIIIDQGGTLDKYIGDEIMAVFGAPIYFEDHAQRASKTAILLCQLLDREKESWEKEGFEPLDICITINTGEMVVGNIGSPRFMNYTVIGDTVNMACRFKEEAKKHKSRIVIGSFTYEKIKYDFNTRYLGEVLLRGKTNPIQIYELISEKD